MHNERCMSGLVRGHGKPAVVTPHRRPCPTLLFDRTDKGGTLKMMTLLDEYTRQSLAIQVERQLTAPQVLAVLEKAMAHYGVPGYIRSDNGPEFIAAKVQQELGENQIKTIYINSGSSWQNDNIQSCQ